VKWFRRYNEPMENKVKLDAILTKMNGGKIEGDWIPAEGFHTSLAIDTSADGSQGVNLNKGITVKHFVNKKTGEVRTYLEEAVK
jgi:hypothetical protein